MGAGSRGFEPGPCHTKDSKNGTSGYLAWRSAFIRQALASLLSLFSHSLKKKKINKKKKKEETKRERESLHIILTRGCCSIYIDRLPEVLGLMNPGQLGLGSSWPGSARPGQLGQVNSALCISIYSYCKSKWNRYETMMLLYNSHFNQLFRLFHNIHTCDEFGTGIREIFLPFQGDF